MRRITIMTVLSAVVLGLFASPAAAKRITLKSLDARLRAMESKYTDVKAQLAAQTAQNKQFRGCLERTFLGEGYGFVYNTNNPPASNAPFGNSYAYGTFFPQLAANALNTPFPDPNYRYWAVGVRNNATCLGLFGYRTVHPVTTAAAALQGAAGGRH
jgi:hypothetical protein